MLWAFKVKWSLPIPKLKEELKLLDEKFDKLKVEVAITRNANSLLLPHLVDAEWQCWENIQYSRRETLEIVGLKSKLKWMCVTFFEVWTAVSIKKIWMPVIGKADKEQVIAKFCRRKDCEKVLKAKNDLRKLKTNKLHLPEGSKIFDNQRDLGFYYCLLWSTSKKKYVIKAKSWLVRFKRVN